jgi:hypothetical protein
VRYQGLDGKDPPWLYGDKLTENYGTVEHHYSPMSIKELCELPIKDKAYHGSLGAVLPLFCLSLGGIIISMVEKSKCLSVIHPLGRSDRSEYRCSTKQSYTKCKRPVCKKAAKALSIFLGKEAHHGTF